MSTPLVSVLMTVHDRETFVGDAIESVLRQTMQDFELVVVDDASTDGSYDVIASHAADARVRIVRSAVNLGQFACRNLALSRARGTYVKYVDADDALLPSCLETMLHVARRHPAAGLLLWSTPEPGTWPREIGPAEVYERAFLGDARLERAPLSVLFRRAELDAACGFDEAFPLTADTDVIARLARTTRVVLGPPGLVFYRRHGGQVLASRAFRDAELGARTTALLRALDHSDCPLPVAARRRARSQLVGGAVRTVLHGLVRERRVGWAVRTLRLLRPGPAELLAALLPTARPAPRDRAGVGPVPDELPHGTDPTAPASGLLSVLVLAPPGTDAAGAVRAAVRLPHAPEVVVCRRDSRAGSPDDAESADSPRVRVVTASPDAAPDELLAAGARAATGRFLAFAEAGRSALHPHVLEAALEALSRPGMPDVVASGPLSGLVGLLHLAPDEAVALEIGSGGGVLGDEPSSLLVSREAFCDAPYSGFGAWDPGVLGRIARLVVRDGVLLGPEGLSTRWQAGSVRVPTRFDAAELASLLGAAPPGGWQAELRASCDELLTRLSARCRGDDAGWLLTRLTGGALSS